MPFQFDENLADDGNREFGEYVITLISARGQVRADLFRRGKVVTAYVSFPTGLDASTVADPYVSELGNYAREHGFPDQFRIVYVVARV